MLLLGWLAILKRGDEMFLIDWIRDYKRMKQEFYVPEKECESCSTLKEQLILANENNQKLLDRILEKPEPEKTANDFEPLRPRKMPWAVLRQTLEQEDRAKFRAQQNAAKPDSVEDLEKKIVGESSGGGGV